MLLPLVLVLVSLALPISNEIKALNFLLIIFFLLRPKNLKEIAMIIIANIVFVVSDIAAVQSGFFKFTNPDLFGLPYWEFFAWGFWILYMYRLLPKHFPSNLQLAAVIGGVLFSQAFGIIESRELLLLVTILIIIVSLKFLHTINDYLYLGYLALVGMAVETVGLYFNLWTYPNSNLVLAAVQFVVMWAGVGLYFRNIIGPFISETKKQDFVLRNHFAIEENNFYKKELGGAQGYKFGHKDYLMMAEAATIDGHSRRAIECLREALYSAQNSLERAKAHLLLSQTYRTIIQMRNARKEIEQAFSEMNLEIPRNYFLQTVKSLLEFSKHFISPDKNKESDESLKLKVALYVEIGLSGYYLREDFLMIQATLRGYISAKKLGRSIEMINWYGGTICVLVLKNKTFMASKLKLKAEQMLNELDTPVAWAKWNIWQAIALDYNGDSKKSVELFEDIFQNHKNHLGIHDLRLGVFTMSCNYLLRGHFEKSIQSLNFLFEKNHSEEGNYFCHSNRFIDWYKIGAFSFTQGDSAIVENLKFSRAIFSHQDEEKWAITQYLGNLLFNIYNNGSKNLAQTDEIEKRFLALKLSPKKTFIEASFFWVALALVRLEQFHRRSISKLQMIKTMRKIKDMPDHPILNQHYRVIKERFEILNSQFKKYYIDNIFINDLIKSENDLAIIEYQRNFVLNEVLGNHPSQHESKVIFLDYLHSKNWSHYQKMNNEWLASLGAETK